MRIVLVILGEGEVETVLSRLAEAGFRVTRLASTGGFLRRGNTTLMIGMEEGKVEQALEILQAELPPPITPETQRAKVFVLNVAQYEQL